MYAPEQNIKMAGKRKYFDLRYLFMRGLISRERWQRTRHYLKSAAECTSRAIVSLELSEQPIKSIAQAKQLEGIGGETAVRLKEILEKKDKSTERPPDGKFVSSAAALLVALLDLTEQVEKSGTGELALIPEDVLKCEARPLCQEAFIEEENGFCQAWWRIEVLIKRGFVKRRKLNKADVYELSIIGREIAHRLQGERQSQLPKEEVKIMKTDKHHVAGASCSNVNTAVPNKGDNYLYSNDRGEDGIILEVDTQEMGGDRVGLGDHCRRLERCGVCYRTCRLGCGDYRWVWRCDGVERTIPLLVERKRGDDIANSLKDGRFWKQVTKMVDWKEEFDKKDVAARLVYVLEGDPADYVVRCADKCQGVGKCGNPTLTQVKLALKDLEDHPQIEIRWTNCIESTIQYLSVITEEIGKRANKGEYDMLIVSEIVEQSKPKEEKCENIPTKDPNSKAAKSAPNENFNLDSKEDIIEIEDSQEIKNELEDFSPSMEDSEELPPLNQKSSSSGQNSKLDETSTAVTKDKCKGAFAENVHIDSKEEVFDIDDELAMFSTFSEHSSLKRTCLETDEDIKKGLCSPVKKIKFTSSADLVESGSQGKISPGHGKIYRMKQKTSPKKRNLMQSLESNIENVSPLSAGGKLKSKTMNTGSNCVKEEQNDSALRVKFPFISRSSSKDENIEFETSASIQSVPSFELGSSERLEPRLKDSDSEDDIPLANGTTNDNMKGEIVSNLKQPIDSDSDSLPDVGIYKDPISESSDPIPSTSGHNDIELNPDLEFVNISTTKTKKGKIRKKASRKTLSHVEDVDDDVEMVEDDDDNYVDHDDYDDDDDDDEKIEDDDDYVPETNRAARKRNRSKKTVQKEAQVSKKLVKQVLDILPHCTQLQAQGALRRSKMNVELAVADLLDSPLVLEDVVDLT